MSLLDAPSITRGLADRSYVTSGGEASALMSALASGKENCCLLVVGDSTGDETTTQGRWVLQVAQWLATQFPEYTVNFRQWNMSSGANGAYDALGTGQSRVLQTGTGTANAGGPFVLDVYNGSASGTAPSYNVAATRWPSMIGNLTPDLVIVNHGHNENGASGEQHRYLLYQLTRAIRTKFKKAGLLITAQNPRASTDPLFAEDCLRARASIYMAAMEGYGLVNVYQRFLNNANYNADWLADGLHPNAAGSEQWANEVISHLATATMKGYAPRNPLAQQNRVWVPAQDFQAYAAGPTLALRNSNFMAWDFRTGATDDIIASVLLPEHWVSYDTYLHWCVAGASGWSSSTVVSWHLLRQRQGASGIYPAESGVSPPPAWSDTLKSINPNNGTAYQVVQSLLAQQSAPVDGNGVMGVRVRRTATDGLDTVAESAYLLGLMFVRAT